MKRKGFTLIELLAVIIILGILLLIAIPGVTSYITNSRKNVYVDTAKELIKGSSNLLNSGDFDTLEEGITYYMDSRCISNESGKEAQSPFGKFNPAYVLVVNENDTYNYYFQSRDETEVGVKDITSMDSLEISKIVSGVKEEDIDTSVAVGNTTKVALIDENCNVGTPIEASRRVSMDGESMITLTFDNQGGTGCDMQSQYYGEEWGKLCKPKKEGLKFAGWYTKPNNEGDKITKTTKAEKSMTVYAAWTDQYATFDIGQNVNAKMKKLSGQSNADYGTHNSNIVNIKNSEDEPLNENMQQENIVSSTESVIPIYMWFDNGTIYWWSVDEEPCLNPNSSYLFNNLFGVKSLDDFDLFDTSKVTSMSYLFNNCQALINIDLSTIDTSNVTDMSCLFYSCFRLNNVDLSNFDTSKVTNFSNMFYWCFKFDYIDLSSFDTSNATNMYGMFDGCKLITDIDVSSFDTSNVTDMGHMFHGCQELTVIDISSFDTTKVTSFKDMFSICIKLNNIIFNDLNTPNLQSTFCMFYNCPSLTTLDLSGIDTSKVTTMFQMFCWCKSLSNLNLTSFDTSNVTDMCEMFGSCVSLTSINLSSFNTSNVIHFGEMFKQCTNIAHLDLSNFDTSKAIYIYSMFSQCINLISLDLSNFSTSNVKSMEYVFEYCKKIESININNFNTSNVTILTGMFRMCESLRSINLSSFDTSKVTTMSGMFEGCKAITSIDLSNFNTSSLEIMGSKRNSLYSTSGDIGMFVNCSSLVSINLSSFNTSHVKYMGELFRGCSSLTVIDLSSFETSNVTHMNEMFQNCTSLTTITVSEKFDLSKVTDQWAMNLIFDNCPSLVGGAGTHWDSSMASDITFAKIDGGINDKGLFTSNI